MKKRIAIFCIDLSNESPAGGQILKIVRELASIFDFTVYSRSIDPELLTFIKHKPVPFLSRISRRLPLYIASYFLFSRSVRNARRSGEYDVIHVIEALCTGGDLVSLHFCAARALQALRAKNAQYPFLKKVYNSLIFRFGNFKEKRIFAHEKLRLSTFVSSGLMKEFESFYKIDAEKLVIPNSLDTSTLTDSKGDIKRNSYGLSGCICSLGDWDRKGLYILLDALSLAKLSGIKCRLYVIGPAESRVVQYIKSHALDNLVELVGKTKEVEKYYKLSDFFILPTAYESFSLVAYEAALNGLPVFATRVSGIDELIVDGENGYFLQRNVESILEKLKWISQNKEKLQQMGKNARKRASAFTLDVIAKDYKKVYERL